MTREFVVVAPMPVNGTHWGLLFSAGIARTENAELAAKLARRGYSVTSPTAEAPTAEAPTAEAPTAEAPTAEAPTAEAPTAEAPTAEAPTAEAPTAEAGMICPKCGKEYRQPAAFEKHVQKCEG